MIVSGGGIHRADGIDAGAVLPLPQPASNTAPTLPAFFISASMLRIYKFLYFNIERTQRILKKQAYTDIASLPYFART